MGPASQGDESEPAIPDTVPVELLRDHGEAARQTVRGSVGFRRRARAVAVAQGDEDVWLLAMPVLVLAVLGLGVLVGLAYAAINWPTITALAWGPPLALMASSYVIAVKLVRRDRRSGSVRSGQRHGPG